MKRFRFWKLDAFTTGASAGNPAGLVLLRPDDSVSDAEMQRLATQVAATGFVTEVAFARPVGPGELALRYFSCEREVPFCGHATVASMYQLLSAVPEYRGLPRLALNTSKGRLEVENRIEAEGCVFIAAPEPAFPELHVMASEAAAALGLPVVALNRHEISPDSVLPVCECGQKCLLVPVAELDALIACSPSYAVLRALADRTGIEVLVLHSKQTHLRDRQLRTRVFAPAFGYLEDPATGSGNAALAHWLRRSGAWTGEALAIEQGPDRVAPNLVTIRAAADGGLRIGGCGVARVEGEYLLH
ncbi:MAG TPA: PhzF family phenazine biosynthesis protein [Opitutaceae bacterium]|nr:PhzF family phenazine biosynthesis protein [Opitutaceae bacterium]